MSDKDTITNVPSGFQRLPEGLGFTDNLQPIYRLVEGQGASFGITVGPRHCNTMGICHGGALMTLADITAATGANLAHGVVTGSPTVHLNIDFISSARQGEWVHAVAEHVTAKRRFGFCSGGIYSGERVIARFSGTVYFREDDLRQAGTATGDGVIFPTEN
ncbi:MAG: PaaI family thioesterase [Halioglobus sp.]|nr:PaaI family thioesterase [Halioglobus sp.]